MLKGYEKDRIKEQLMTLCQDSGLMNLFTFSDDWKRGHIEHSESKEVNNFLDTLVNLTAKARRANTGKVVIKTKTIYDFKAMLNGFIMDFPNNIKNTQGLEKLFKETFFDYFVREPLTRRTYACSTEDKNIPFYFCLADDDEKIIVSKGVLDDFYVDLDIWLGKDLWDKTNKHIDFLVDPLIEKLHELKNHGMNTVCLLNKTSDNHGIKKVYYKGIKKIESFLSKEQIETMGYNQKEGEIRVVNVLHYPNKESPVCLISDITMYGNDLEEAVNALRSKGYKVEKGIVLLDYRNKEDKEKLGGLEIESIVDTNRFSRENLKDNGQYVRTKDIYSREELSGDFEEGGTISSVILNKKEQEEYNKRSEDIKWWEDNKKYYEKTYSGYCVAIAEKRVFIDKHIKGLNKKLKKEGINPSCIMVI
ncbi:MAG: hypothetical protein KKA64_00550 [Nanoarchaeota archaeon]|nr:hypothetical protein [Nanoarchaeota archaeon]